MNELDTQIQTIEITIEELEQAIQRRDDLDTLNKNPAFQRLILQGYFKDLASNTVMLKANKNHKEEWQQKDLDMQLMGIASLNEYFGVTRIKAESAEKDLLGDHTTLEELRAEVSE